MVRQCVRWGVVFAILLSLGTFAVAAPKTAVLVISPGNFQDDEFAIPQKALADAGVRTVVAGRSAQEYRGSNGTVVKAEVRYADLTPKDFDALVVVGGLGCIDYLWGDAALQGLVRESAAAGKIVGAICAGPVVLARAGILKDKRATCYPAGTIESELTSASALLTKDPVVRDGTIITGNGPDASAAFGKALADALQ